MGANAGYKCIVQINNTTYQTVTQIKSAELTVGLEMYDVTDLNNKTWKDKLPGLADYGLKLSGNFDMTDAQQKKLQGAIITTPGLKIDWKLFPLGIADDSYAGSGYVKNFTAKFAVGSEQQISFDIDGTGAITFTDVP